MENPRVLLYIFVFPGNDQVKNAENSVSLDLFKGASFQGHESHGTDGFFP